MLACWRILSRRLDAVTVIHTSFCSAVLEVLWPLWSSASSATLWGFVWFDIQSVFEACTTHWDDVSCCKEDIMSIPATWAHASEKGCKREPSNKEPLVVGPLSPRAGSKSSLGCLTFILSAQFPKLLFESSGWAGSAALGLFDDLLENIFGRTGSGNKILFVSWWVGHPWFHFDRVPIPLTQMDHRISAAPLLGPVQVCEIQYTFLKTSSCSPIQCFGSMFLSKQFRTRQRKEWESQIHPFLKCTVWEN